MFLGVAQARSRSYGPGPPGDLGRGSVGAPIRLPEPVTKTTIESAFIRVVSTSCKAQTQGRIVALNRLATTAARGK